MITIKSIGYKHGYTGYDHLLGDELSVLVGRQFRSAHEAGRAANRIQSKEADRRVRHAPITAEVLFADGSTRRFTMPGGGA